MTRVRQPNRAFLPGRQNTSYLVDPASSHMLVSKIKPCMSKCKLLHSETANGSLNQLWFLRSYNPTWITVVILELIHATKLRPSQGRALLLDQNQYHLVWFSLVTLDNFVLIVWPPSRRRIFQMSALSSFIRRCYAYEAYNG